MVAREKGLERGTSSLEKITEFIVSYRRPVSKDCSFYPSHFLLSFLLSVVRLLLASFTGETA